METYQVSAIVKLTKKPVVVEVKAESQQAAEAHVAEHCPDVDVKKTELAKK